MSWVDIAREAAVSGRLDLSIYYKPQVGAEDFVTREVVWQWADCACTATGTAENEQEAEHAAMMALIDWAHSEQPLTT